MVWQSEDDVSSNFCRRSGDAQAGYLAVVLDAMANRRLSVRDLAGATGIRKSRLGVVLHRNSAKRLPITVPELQMLLNALDIPILHAWLRGEALWHQELHRDARLTSLFPLLADFYLDLPRKLMDAITSIEGADGTELRSEWSGPLASAVAKRMAYEITRVVERRNVLMDLRL